MPPTPESNIATGREASRSCVESAAIKAGVSQERLVGHEEDRHDDDQPGQAADLAQPLRDRGELGAEGVAALQLGFGERLRPARLRLEEAVLEGEEGDD